MDKKIAALLKELFTCEAFHILKKIPLSPGFPSQNYIGVNFNNSEVLSLKLYYSFFFPVDLELVDGYIPDSTMYKRFINYYTPQTERSIVNNGLTFSLKINNSGLLTKGYHFRFDKNISELPPIKSFQCSADDILNVGLCEEFSSRGNFLKYYYYFNKLYNKEKFAVRFNKPHLVGADLIEYTESDQFNKVIGCNVSNNKFYSSFLKFDSLMAPEMDRFFGKQLGLDSHIAHGFYENEGVEAKYFFKLNSSRNASNAFDLPENRHINTVDAILDKFI